MSQRVHISQAGRSDGRSFVPTCVPHLYSSIPACVPHPRDSPWANKRFPFGELLWGVFLWQRPHSTPNGSDLPQKTELPLQRPKGAILISPGRIPGFRNSGSSRCRIITSFGRSFAHGNPRILPRPMGGSPIGERHPTYMTYQPGCSPRGTPEVSLSPGIKHRPSGM
jgi:hypothetical protein